jgi:hypothetical protein
VTPCAAASAASAATATAVAKIAQALAAEKRREGVGGAWTASGGASGGARSDRTSERCPAAEGAVAQ